MRKYIWKHTYNLNSSCHLQIIEIERMLGQQCSVQGPLLLKLLFVGLKTMSPSVTAKHRPLQIFHIVLVLLFNQ